MEEPIDDPGALEGIDKSQKEHEPPSDHPRFKEIYGKFKEGERQLEELNRKYSDQSKEAQILISNNNKLMEKLSTNQATKQVDTTITDLQSKLVALRTQKANLLENEKYVESGKVDDEILDTKLALFTQQIPKPVQVDKETLKKEVVAETALEASKTLLTEFERNAAWYQKGTKNYNFAMAAFAEGLDKNYFTTYPDQRTRLAKIKSEVEKQFNWQGKGVEVPEELYVESVGSTVAITEKTVKLSAEEKRIAGKSFPELSQAQAEATYAKGKKLLM